MPARRFGLLQRKISIRVRATLTTSRSKGAAGSRAKGGTAATASGGGASKGIWRLLLRLLAAAPLIQGDKEG